MSYYHIQVMTHKTCSVWFRVDMINRSQILGFFVKFYDYIFVGEKNKKLSEK